MDAVMAGTGAGAVGRGTGMPDEAVMASDMDGIAAAAKRELEAVLRAGMAAVEHGPQPVGHHLGRVFDGMWARGGEDAPVGEADARAVFLSRDACGLMRVDVAGAFHADVARHGVSFATFLRAVAEEDRPGVEHVLRGGCFRDEAGRPRPGLGAPSEARHDHALCFCGRPRRVPGGDAGDPARRTEADREAAEAATMEADPVCFAEFRILDPALARGYEWARILVAPEMPGGRTMQHLKGLHGLVADIPDAIMHLD